MSLRNDSLSAVERFALSASLKLDRRKGDNCLQVIEGDRPQEGKGIV